MTEVSNGFWNRNPIRAIFCALALFAFSITGFAAKAPQWGTAGMTSNGSKSWSMSPGAGDLRVPITNPGGGWQTAGNYGVQNGATGLTFRLGADGTVFRSMPDGTTIKYPAHIESPLSVADIAKGAAGLLSGPYGMACALACPFLIDWLTKSGGRLNPEKNNQLERKKEVPCTGYCWEWEGPSPNEGTIKASSAAEYCSIYASTYAVRWPNEGPVSVRNVEPLGEGYARCDIDRAPWAGSITQFVSGLKKDNTLDWLPSSMDDIAPYMAKIRPNPGVVKELLDKGVDVPLPGEPTSSIPKTDTKVTGPTKIDGPAKETTNSDGTRTVEKTTYNFQTSGNTVNNTTNNITTTTYNTDNSVRSVVTTTSTPTDNTVPEEEEKEEEKEQCEEGSTKLSCAEMDTPEGEIPKTTKNITFEAEEGFLGTGACPANVVASFSSAPGLQSKTIVNWSSFCDQALPLRAIIMTMAAIMAFFIVMPGGRVE